MVARESQDLPRRIADLAGRDAYAVLGLTSQATDDDVMAAYRREMAHAHPDRGGSDARAQEVNCAYEVLTRHREEYDELTGRGAELTFDPFELFERPDDVGGEPEVLYVEPDVEPLDDPGPGRRPLRSSFAGLAAGVAVLAASVIGGVVVLDRLSDSPIPVASDSWTTTGAGTASLPSTAPAASTPSSAPATSVPPASVTATPVPASSAPAPPSSSAPATTPSAAPASVAPSQVPASETWSVPSPATTAVLMSASATGADGVHRCEIRADASLWCAGANAHGQVGDGSSRDVAQLVRIGADARWQAVAVGGQSTCGLHVDGSLWCWGDNTFGQVGDGTGSDRAQPVPIDPPSRWLAVDVDTHGCAVRSDRTLWCWGRGQDGELGRADHVDQASPIRLGATPVWARVTVGAGWTCGVRQDGTRQCWGVGRVP